ncbi:helix-turn-helix domain-containing protein [Anaerosinus massiliensis]|uniref:helix-turn-helix domain-containing protein n=1 Tax=Massilibacillus massiliensis TaxID=1806837 RepID=UPI000DA60675|nr:helix-turn-helix domain-containing protein [Massilibacillus massiliensis]
MFNRYFFSYRLNLSKVTHNLTNTRLAALLGLKSRTSINDFESQRSLPSADILYDLSDLFGISIDWLTGRIDDPYNNEMLLKLEEQHLQNFLSKKAIFIPTNYQDPSTRINLYSLEVRANIVFLFSYVQRFFSSEILETDPTETKKNFEQIAPFIKRLSFENDRIVSTPISPTPTTNLDKLNDLLQNPTSPIFDITKPPEQK